MASIVNMHFVHSAGPPKRKDVLQGEPMADSLHDLNFLYLVDALHKEGSVSGAARRLNLTQPAVSHALNRVRTRFGDQLFVRSGAGMAPTPMGERLALAARRALALIQADILEEPSFDLGHTE